MPILTAEERVGSTIGGRYRLDRVIGRGGMATVLEGTHTINGRKVAVKLLNPELSTDADVVGRFVQEARAAATLDHPNVVSVLDTGQDADGTPFLVLELLRGETLAERIKRQGRLSLAETLSLLLPVLEALAAAHACGIVHRDIKPENVFLALDATGRMTPKLLDFGIARVAESHGRTATGVALGTPYYMSPEQVEMPTTVGPASDVWSMGVVLYQCLTGTLPFTGQSSSSVLVAIMTTAPPSIASRGLGIEPAITEVVDRALSRDPAARFASAHELAIALVAAARGEHIGPAAPRRRIGPGFAFLVLTATVVFVGAAIAVAYFAANGRLQSLLGTNAPVAIRPVVVDVEDSSVAAVIVVASADAGTALDAALAIAPTDGGALAVAASDAGAYPAFAFGIPDGAIFPPNMRFPTPEQIELAVEMGRRYQALEERRAHEAHATPAPPDAPTTDLARRAHACHSDDCIIETLRGHAMTEQELSMLIEAHHRQGTLRAAQRPLARYLELFPTGPHAAEYRRLLRQAVE